MKKLLVLLMLVPVLAFAQDIRIACIGNSITSYTGNPDFPSPDSYPWQMRHLFGEGYDIQNFGVSGTTMLKNGDKPYWDEDAFSDALAFEPDIVTIMLGTNDSKPQNWGPFKGEYVDDYKAMIDTFRTLPSNPQIFVCIPSKAFSSKYDITDSVIVNDIKPMIEQMAPEMNLPIIDFYTFHEDKPHLMYDGIHPTFDGLWEYAKMLYLAIKDLEAPATETISDVDLVKDMPVTIEGIETLVPITGMTDGDYFTTYPVESGAVIELSLANIASIDMVQILLGNYYAFDYKVETSIDQLTWVDQGAETQVEEVSAAALDFAAVDAQFLRITLNHESDVINVTEIKVLETAPVHAPMMTFIVDRVKSTMVRYHIDIVEPVKDVVIRYGYASDDNPFTGGTAFRNDSTLHFTHSTKVDAKKTYFAKSYANGVEAVTDTFVIDYSFSSIEKNAVLQPFEMQLHQNYPNPFNPSTVIEYDLNKSAHVKLSVFDCTGRLVQELVNEAQHVGPYSIVFDASQLSSGLYFYTLEANQHKTTRKMVLMH